MRFGRLTSQKNSFPLNPQNQDIHDTSSELLISKDLQQRNEHNYLNAVFT